MYIFTITLWQTKRGAMLKRKKAVVFQQTAQAAWSQALNSSKVENFRGKNNNWIILQNHNKKNEC